MEPTSLPLLLIVDEADNGECGLFPWAGGLPEAELQCWAGDSPATGSEQNVGPQVRTEGEDDPACTPACPSRPTEGGCSFLGRRQAYGGREEAFFY